MVTPSLLCEHRIARSARRREEARSGRSEGQHFLEQQTSSQPVRRASLRPKDCPGVQRQSSSSIGTMSSLEPFIKAYHETVASDRMSSSRVDRIRTEAMRQFHQSSALVAAIEREHRQAHGKTSLSSLYLFDAVCRWAKDIVRKKASGFDYKSAESPRGSKAERGSKQALIEGARDFSENSLKVVDDIVISTLDEMREDQREKVAKVVEIWRKADTFDADTVSRLHRHIRSEGTVYQRQEEAPYSRDDGPPSPYGQVLESRKADTDTDATAIEVVKEAAASRAAGMPNVPSNILAMLGGGDRSQGDGQRTQNAIGGTKSLDADQLEALKRFASMQQSSTPPARGQSQHTSVDEPSVSAHSHPAPGAPPMHPDRLRQMNSEANSAESRSAAAVSTEPQWQPPSALLPAKQTEPEVISQREGNVAGFVPDESVGDLSQFDFSSFDPSSASSWLLFAQQWHNTYQYVPTNQELLNGMFSGMQAQVYMQAQQMMAAGFDDGPTTDGDIHAASTRHREGNNTHNRW